LKIREEGFPGRLILLSRDPLRRNADELEYWPFEDFLEMLWLEYG